MNIQPVPKRHRITELTDEQITQIRRSKETQMELAKRFGISQPSVSNIKLGKRRKK